MWGAGVASPRERGAAKDERAAACSPCKALLRTIYGIEKKAIRGP